MKDSIRKKLEILVERLEEVNHLISDPEVIGNQKKFRVLTKEYAQISPIVETFLNYCSADDDLNEAKDMIRSGDPELKEMGQEELPELNKKIAGFEANLQKMLLPKDPNDDANIFLEIRAGTGGDEAAIFAGDLFKMYSRFVEKLKWQLEIINAQEGEHGGYKEIIVRISGDEAYSKLKFE